MSESLAFKGQPPCTPLYLRSLRSRDGPRTKPAQDSSAGRKRAESFNGVFQAPEPPADMKPEEAAGPQRWRRGHRGQQRGRAGWRLFSQVGCTDGSRLPGSGDRPASFLPVQEGRLPPESTLASAGERGGDVLSQVPAPHITLMPSSTFWGGIFHGPPSPEHPWLAVLYCRGEATGQPGTAARLPAADSRAWLPSPCFSGRGLTACPAPVLTAAWAVPQPAARLLGHRRVLAGPWAALIGDRFTHRLTR